MFCIAFDETGIKGGKNESNQEKKKQARSKKKRQCTPNGKKSTAKKNGLDVKSIVTRGSKIVV